MLQTTKVNEALPICVREVVSMGRYASTGAYRWLDSTDKAAIAESMDRMGITMNEASTDLIVSERPGSERSISLTTLTRHPGALRDGSAIHGGHTGAAIPVRLIMSTEQPYILATDSTGSYVACIPTIDLLHGGHLLVATDEEPRAPERGGPIRLVVVDGATLCWNVKDVASLRAIPDRVPDSIPQDRPH